MRERSDVMHEPDSGEEVKHKRIDLNVPQVAGGAVAAVVAAKLASYFGVYGTILGAGVVSVIATCGGSVFQHFLKRTGEQIREVKVPARPGDATRASPEAPGPQRQSAKTAGPDLQHPPRPGEFTEGTVYRARVRSWKRPVVAAALVFGVTMAGITTYELASGESFSGGGSTTVGNAFSGGGKSSGNTGDPDPGDGSATTPTPGASQDTPGGPGATPSDGATSGDGTETGPTPTPSGSPGEGTGGTGETDGQGSGDGSPPDTAPPSAPATTPAPSASSRSGTAVPDQDGPAAP
ncbi:hypothetical protein ACIQAC_16890 [Streptomyces sp. NPDC088387]|uniref:hypothetical protein n=1 Tax=Streptomyces sp. NPDC088387 TaxID=3365859 RepID=UPI00381EF18F